MNNLKIKLMKTIVRWSNNWFLKVPNGDLYIDHFFGKVEQWILTKGVDHTIQRVKAIKLHVTRAICGHPLLKAHIIGIGLNSKGIPTTLGPLQNLITGTTSEKRLLLTLLSISRALPGSHGSPNLRTIEEPSTMDPGVIPELEYLLPAVLDQMMLPRTAPQWSNFHLTTKAGPNSLAVKGSLLDAHLLPDNLIKDIGILAGKELSEAIDHVRMFDLDAIKEHVGGKPKMLLRKLSLILEPESKIRIIAILDYWTQSALKPLHDKIMKILSGIDSDFTFRQDKVAGHLGKGPYYSLDLSSATDRFPITIQKMVVKYLVNQEYSDAWERVLTQHEFYAPTENRSVKYAAGQPMGAYSSWAVFALTHHAIVRCAAMMVGKTYWSDYAILGDDIVIADKDVAESYKTLISRLGVQISEAKSHVSNDTYEFAKRWYHNGIEISGIQLRAFLNCKSWYSLTAEYQNVLRRWEHSGSDVEPGALRELLAKYFSLPSARTDRLLRKALTFLLLPWDRPGVDRGEQILQFVRTICPEVLGCFQSRSRAEQFLIPALAENKARVLEASLLKLRGQSADALKVQKRLIRHYRGSDAQSALLSIPSVKLIFDQYQDTREQLENIRDPMITSPESLVMNKAALLGFDPDRINTKRNHEILLATNATLVNNFAKWYRDHCSISLLIQNNTWDENTERAKTRILFRTQIIGTVMPGFPL